MKDLYLIIAVFFGMQIVITPLLIWFRLRIPATINYTPIGSEEQPAVLADMPPEAKTLQYNPAFHISQTNQNVLHDTVTELEKLGYTLTSRLVNGNSFLSNMQQQTHIAVLHDPATQTVATCIIAAARGGLQVTRRSQAVSFYNEYADGRRIATSGCEKLVGFRRNPTDLNVCFKLRCISMMDLHRIHRELIARHASGPAVDPLADGAPAMLQRLNNEALKYQARCGLMKRVANGQYWRRTLLGAYWSTWHLIWPMSYFFWLALRIQQRKWLRGIKIRTT